MKKLQLILDRRQPLFLPYHFVNTLLIKKKIEKISVPNKLYLLMTYDVENFWGAENGDRQEENIKFLAKIQNVRNSNATFLVPGNLVSPLASSLKDIEKNNEIGLHGHHHELWREANFVTKKPIKDSEKKALLSDSLSEFEKNGLKLPIAFRAPYMWCKKSDMKLLNAMKFKVDSSDNPQYGVYRTRKNGKIMRIPVTTKPLPYYNKRRGLVYAKFHLLNMKLFHDFSIHNIYECIDLILKLQSSQNQIPHLVFLGHSWEFCKGVEKGWGDSFNHRGESNYEILKDKLDLLEKKYSVTYVTFNEFRHIFERQTTGN